jgi:Tol biopolymer transport system component
MGLITDLRCSPDGEQLAFVQRPYDRPPEMMVLDRSNAAHVVQTSPAGGLLGSLAWTPDGKRLRFITLEFSRATGATLFSMSLRGDIRPLYRFPEGRVLHDIAPDGTMIFSILDSLRQHALMRPGQPSHREVAGAWAALIDLSRDGQTLLLAEQWEGTAVLAPTDGTTPKVLGPGSPLALSPDGRRVALTSLDERGLFLVPTGAGMTEEVPVSGLVSAGAGSWSRDGRRLWINARQKDRAWFQLFPVDIATRTLLEPIPGSDISQGTSIAVSPDDRWIAATGADRALTVYPVDKGEPIRISSADAELTPWTAGWTNTGELWLVLHGTPPRLVRVELPDGKITRSMDVDLRQLGGDEMIEARITPDESLLAIEYVVWRGRLELVKGIPADR